MAQFPCLPLWTDALLADTGHLSDAEFGRYMRVLILMWRTPGCKVPNDDAWLTRHLPHSPSIEDIRATLAEYCTTDGNFVAQKRLSREYVDRWQFKGRMTAARKAHKRKKNGAHTSANTQVSQYPSLNLNTQENLPSGEVQQQTENQPPEGSRTPLADGELARPPQSLAELNQAMGWTPSGTRKPFT